MKIIFLFILFTQNNIFLALTTYEGKIIFWKSLGSLKTKGLKKINNSVLKSFLSFCFKKFLNNNFLKFHVQIKGFNKFKKSFLRILFILLSNFTIISLKDSLLYPYNGCKLKKKRRL